MLSAVILAQNEAHRLARCLESVAFADERLVVDGGSTDGTTELARNLGARVEQHPFEGFLAQRTYGVLAAREPWVLSLDADEVVPPALGEEIRRILAAPSCAAYRIPRLDYMFGRWIRHGGWYPQYHVQLFDRGRGHWEAQVHERWITSGSVGTLRQPVLHYSHLEVTDFVAKLNRYTSIAATERVRAGERIAFWRLLLEPPAYFGYKYLWQGGILDGAHGFLLASLLAFYRLTELAKVRCHDSAQRVNSP